MPGRYITVTLQITVWNRNAYALFRTETQRICRRYTPAMTDRELLGINPYENNRALVDYFLNIVFLKTRTKGAR